MSQTCQPVVPQLVDFDGVPRAVVIVAVANPRNAPITIAIGITIIGFFMLADNRTWVVNISGVCVI